MESYFITTFWTIAEVHNREESFSDHRSVRMTKHRFNKSSYESLRACASSFEPSTNTKSPRIVHS